MHTIYAQKAQIGTDVTKRLDGCCTDRYHGVLVELPSDYDDLYRRIVRQRLCNRRTMRDYSSAKVLRKMLCQLQWSSATIQNNHLILTDELNGCLRDSSLRPSSLLLTSSETSRGRRTRERSSMHTLKQSSCGQFTQVTPDRIF